MFEFECEKNGLFIVEVAQWAGTEMKELMYCTGGDVPTVDPLQTQSGTDRWDELLDQQ